MLDSARKLTLAAWVAFAVGMILAPIVIKLASKLKAGQVVLGYVEQHKSKSGTPTMGGIIFILPIVLSTLLFGYSEINLVAVSTTVAYAILGFLDDFIKVRFKQNLGLRAYQKLIGQFGIAALVAIYAYKSPFVGSEIYLPLSDKTFDLKGWYVPFAMLVLIASTNAVNLTDGLDGLAGSVSVVYFAVFSVIILLLSSALDGYGRTIEAKELSTLTVFCGAAIGGVSAFLWRNANPAEIMMGDTGSLALGGAVAALGLFSKSPLLIPFAGIMYVVSCISVIMQVAAFKLTGKRIFKMSPFHHHLEKCGVKEQKIVWWYVIVTLIFGLAAISCLGV